MLVSAATVYGSYDSILPLSAPQDDDLANGNDDADSRDDRGDKRLARLHGCHHTRRHDERPQQVV